MNGILYHYIDIIIYIYIIYQLIQQIVVVKLCYVSMMLHTHISWFQSEVEVKSFPSAPVEGGWDQKPAGTVNLRHFCRGRWHFWRVFDKRSRVSLWKRKAQ